jgi:uncharacterized Tic20 family protein
MNEAQERNWAMAAHLMAFLGYLIPFGNFLGPLIVYLTQKEKSEFIEEQALESMNFQLNLTIALFLAFMSLWIFIGVILLPALVLGSIALVIMAAIASSKGDHYRYPFCFRFIGI